MEEEYCRNTHYRKCEDVPPQKQDSDQQHEKKAALNDQDFRLGRKDAFLVGRNQEVNAQRRWLDDGAPARKHGWDAGWPQGVEYDDKAAAAARAQHHHHPHNKHGGRGYPHHPHRPGMGDSTATTTEGTTVRFISCRPEGMLTVTTFLIIVSALLAVSGFGIYKRRRAQDRRRQEHLWEILRN